MTNSDIKIVYVTSGIDELVQQFHSMPGIPAAIIEITDRSNLQKLRLAVRSVAGLLWPERFPSLSAYCRTNDIQHIEFPKTKRSRLHETVSSLEADLLVSYRCPYLPVDAINSARLGGINIHFSKLPDYRGGDPLLWQVLHGVPEATVTVHKLTDKIDFGLMLEQDSAERPTKLSRTGLRKFVNQTLSARLLANAIYQLQSGSPNWIEQTDKENPIPAPNMHNDFWQEYIQENDLGEDHMEDIRHFCSERK